MTTKILVPYNFICDYNLIMRRDSGAAVSMTNGVFSLDRGVVGTTGRFADGATILSLAAVTTSCWSPHRDWIWH